MPKITFRQATPDDLDALVTLRARFLSEVQSADASAPALLFSLRRYFKSALPASEFIAYVALIDAHIVATCGLVLHHHPPTAADPSGKEAYILNVYTLPKCRRHGLATALLQKIIEHAKTLQVSRITLHALGETHPLYKSLGFSPTDNELHLNLPQ